MIGSQFLKKLCVFCLCSLPMGAFAQQAEDASGPLRLEITEGVIEPMPIALAPFVASSAAAKTMARQVSDLVIADLRGTGLFRAIPEASHIAQITSFSSPIQFADWSPINAEALITGAVIQSGTELTVQFRVFDVVAQKQLGEGLQFKGTQEGWRRMAHKVADAVYTRLTGEGAYFDSRVAFVSESGPKNNRAKRLAIMDYDGANVTFLTSDRHLVLAPRFSPDGRYLLYTSYETGFPRVYLMEIATLERRILAARDGNMTFAPRFSPDGRSVVFSLEQDGNSDIYKLLLRTGALQRLTTGPAIETAPSFSPDGASIVFESDRSGSPQLYVMSASGGDARRISRGDGRYGTPVWSPRGDMVAFTKQHAGRFHIGVMRTDGTEERLLTGAFLDEGPTWAPNGRVVMFTRQTAGARGEPALYSVDITGRNLQRVPTPRAASDPAWSPLLK